MTRSQRNRQSPGRARRGTLSQPSHSTLQVSNEHHPMGMVRLGHALVSETDKSIAMNTCGTSRRKSRKHRPEHQWLMAKRRRLTRSGVRRYRWSHRKPPRAPTEPKSRGDTPPQELMLTNDGNRQQRHCARRVTMRWDRPTRPTQRKGRGHAQDIARERQQSPPHKRTRTPPRRSEGWNE